MADRTDHYVTFASGHQVAQERIHQAAYITYREDKLQIQHEANNSIGDNNNALFKGVKVYINGYLEGTTDIEVKKVVVQCGGQIAWVVNYRWNSKDADFGQRTVVLRRNAPT